MSVKDFTKGTANIPRPRGKKAWPTDSVDAVLQEGAAVLTPPAADKIGRGNLRQLAEQYAEPDVPEKEWVPARVAPGEAVLPPGAAEAIGRKNIKRLNEQHSPGKVKNMKKNSIRGYAGGSKEIPRWAQEKIPIAAYEQAGDVRGKWSRGKYVADTLTNLDPDDGYDPLTLSPEQRTALIKNIDAVPYDSPLHARYGIAPDMTEAMVKSGLPASTAWHPELQGELDPGWIKELTRAGFAKNATRNPLRQKFQHAREQFYENLSAYPDEYAELSEGDRGKATNHFAELYQKHAKLGDAEWLKKIGGAAKKIPGVGPLLTAAGGAYTLASSPELRADVLEGNQNALRHYGRAALEGGGAAIGGGAGVLGGAGVASIPLGIAGGLAGEEVGSRIADKYIGPDNYATGSSNVKKSIRGYANATEYVPFPNTGGKKPRQTKAVKAVTASNVADIEAFGKTLEKNALRDRVTGNIATSQQGRTNGFSEFDQKAVEAPARAEERKQAIQSNDEKVRQYMADKKAKVDAKTAADAAAAEKQRATIEQVKNESQTRAENTKNSLRRRTSAAEFTGTAPNEAVVDAERARAGFTGSEASSPPKAPPPPPTGGSGSRPPLNPPDVPKTPGLFSRASRNLAKLGARAAAPLVIGKEIYDTSQNQQLLDDISKFKNDPMENLDVASDLLHYYGRPLAEGLGGAGGALLGTAAGLGIASAPAGVAGGVLGAMGAGEGYDALFGESKYRATPSPTATAPTVAPTATPVAPTATPVAPTPKYQNPRAVADTTLPGGTLALPQYGENVTAANTNGTPAFSNVDGRVTAMTGMDPITGRVSDERYNAAQKVHQDRLARLADIDAKRAAFPGKGPMLARIGDSSRNKYGLQPRGTSARRERAEQRAHELEMNNQSLRARAEERAQAQANADRAFEYQVRSDQAAAQTAADASALARQDKQNTIYNDDGSINERATNSLRANTDRFMDTTGMSPSQLATDTKAQDLQAFARRAYDPGQAGNILYGGASMYDWWDNMIGRDKNFRKLTEGQPTVITPDGALGGRRIDVGELTAQEKSGLRQALLASIKGFEGGPQAYIETLRRANPDMAELLFND